MKRSRAPSSVKGRAPLHSGVARRSADTEKENEKPKAQPQVKQAAHQGNRKQTPSALFEVPETCFAVLYTKRSKKKNKVYSDGVLNVKNDKLCVLLNSDGKQVGQSRFNTALGGLKIGNTLEIGANELEITDLIDTADFRSGRCFLSDPAPQASTLALPPDRVSKKFKVVAAPTQGVIKGPRHDPNQPGAIVLDPGHGQGTVAVVVDPVLSKHMRPHQKEGVLFLYRCISGQVRVPGDGHGAVLADDMGLGKSLQALTLIWTALKQGPSGKQIVQRAVIVCPASLVGNWKNEVKKWLGDERLKPTAIAGSTSAQITSQVWEFVNGNPAVSPLLIISYELFRRHIDTLKDSCGMVVCDEGHRLKSSAGNKTIDSLNSLPTRKRIILTGTPVQNDLEEFFAMCNFVNPGALGNLSTFRSIFGKPISASRDATASFEEQKVGQDREAELQRIAKLFVLRRTAHMLTKYLPEKTESVVFCRLEQEQARSYEKECAAGVSCLTGKAYFGAAFSTITSLRKLCNFPDELEEESADINPFCSGKLSFLMHLIQEIRENTSERVVLVSNFTRSLDIFEKFLKLYEITFCRLDGSTPAQSRSALVDKFNDRRSNILVFLLSSKAGGVGLNLIGASRLVLYDPDWNPATDKQAMARVWRDGQKRPVFVYRLLSTGTIEEKIYQRQLFKGQLESAVEQGNGTPADSAPKTCNFSREELRELFTLRTETKCDTLDILRDGEAGQQDLSRQMAKCENNPVQDQVLARVLLLPMSSVSFVYESKNSEAVLEPGSPGDPEGVSKEMCDGEVDLVNDSPAGSSSDGDDVFDNL